MNNRTAWAVLNLFIGILILICSGIIMRQMESIPLILAGIFCAAALLYALLVFLIDNDE